MISRAFCPRKKTFVVTSDDERLNGVPGNDEYDLIDDVPSVTICLAPDWCSVIIGALEKFYDDDLWGPDADPYFYQQQLDKLIVALSAEPTLEDCTDCVPGQSSVYQDAYAKARYDDGSASYRSLGLVSGYSGDVDTCIQPLCTRFGLQMVFYSSSGYSAPDWIRLKSFDVSEDVDLNPGDYWWVDIGGNRHTDELPPLDTPLIEFRVVSNTTFSISADW